VSTIPKVMLASDASEVDLNTLQYPLRVSPKLDGVRCLVWEGVAYSRNHKPIRNKFVQDWCKTLHNLDGELVVGSPTDSACLGNTQSGVMSTEGEPDFRFHLFDCVEGGGGQEFFERLEFVQYQMAGEPRIELVPHPIVTGPQGVQHYEDLWLAEGYEGIMLRDPHGPYKHGRSSPREGYLMKLKRFMDGEGVVTRLEEAEHNTNGAKRDELGRLKRSSAKAGKIGNGMVGTIVIHDKKWGEMRLAPGVMTHFERQLWWDARASRGRGLVGKTVHWRAFGYGVKDKPRFPRFYGLRDDV